MRVNPAAFPKYLDHISYEEHGDRFEREYGYYLSSSFPNCERFWRAFVVPSTERVEGYPTKITLNLNVRPQISPEIEDIANVHYSMFLNLVFAHLHLENKLPSSLENFYTHLGTVCDLAEMAIERWYFLCLNIEKKQSRVLQGLSRDQFLEIAGKLYDERYKGWYQYYLQRGKNPPINLISRTDILVEYLGKDSQVRKEYAAHSQAIRQIRNVIVHDVKVARIIEKDGQILIPKPSVITKYRSWRNVAAVINDQAIIARDFNEQYQQAEQDIIALENILNKMWEILVNHVESEFYSAEKTSLRDMFNIEFFSGGPIILDFEGDAPGDTKQFVPPSGSYGGGSVEYPSMDENPGKKKSGNLK
jgi:hypothetical protein